MGKYLIVKNEFNKVIGVLKHKDVCTTTTNISARICDFTDSHLVEHILMHKESDKNLNSLILSDMYDLLKRGGLTLLQFKFIKKRSNNYYYIIKINTVPETLFCLCNGSNFYFETNDHEKVNGDMKKALKVYSDYHKKCERLKRGAIIYATRSQITLQDRLVFSVSIVLLVLSLAMIIIKEELAILWLSLCVTIIPIIPKVSEIIYKYCQFVKTCKLSTFVRGESADNIISKVVDKKTFSAKYKNFDVMCFSGSRSAFKLSSVTTSDFSKVTEAFIFSDEQNKGANEYFGKLAVIKQTPKICLSTNSVKALACIVTNKVNNDTQLNNGKLLGVSTDILCNENREVSVKKVRYYDYISTDELIFKNVGVATKPSEFVMGTEHTLSPITGGLNDMEKSYLTNLIGVNLIVELKCEDKVYYIVNVQSMFNDVNGSKFVPSASGSVEYKDYKRIKGKKKTFKELLKIGMFRELEEECYITLRHNRKTKDYFYFGEGIHNFEILGFARLVSKAGKPDFFAKLTINTTDCEMKKYLDNYDAMQNKILNDKRKMKLELESTKTMIVSQEDLLGDVLKPENQSPQLQYMIYLLNNKKSV